MYIHFCLNGKIIAITSLLLHRYITAITSLLLHRCIIAITSLLLHWCIIAITSLLLHQWITAITSLLTLMIDASLGRSRVKCNGLRGALGPSLHFQMWADNAVASHCELTEMSALVYISCIFLRILIVYCKRQFEIVLNLSIYITFSNLLKTSQHFTTNQ